MQFGDYRVEIVPDTEFRLDGGAMFGVVPRALWSKVCPPDEDNRITMNMNCVFIDTGAERILIETGIGEKWSSKHTAMFGITRERALADSWPLLVSRVMSLLSQTPMVETRLRAMPPRDIW